MMMITPSNGGPLSGKLERRVPAGSRLVIMDGQGRVISQAAINLTFALRGVFPTQPNYICFACNNHHAKKA